MSAFHPVALNRMVRPGGCSCETSDRSLLLAQDGHVTLLCFECCAVDETEVGLLCAEANAGEATTEILPSPVEHDRDAFVAPEPPWGPLLGLSAIVFSAFFALGFFAAVLWRFL